MDYLASYSLLLGSSGSGSDSEDEEEEGSSSDEGDTLQTLQKRFGVVPTQKRKVRGGGRGGGREGGREGGGGERVHPVTFSSSPTPPCSSQGRKMRVLQRTKSPVMRRQSPAARNPAAVRTESRQSRRLRRPAKQSRRRETRRRETRRRETICEWRPKTPLCWTLTIVMETK